MVFELRDKGSPQWHLSGMLGEEQQECPLQSLRPGILEQYRELLLNLLLDLDAFLWLLCATPSLPSQQSTSVLSWQSHKASVYGRQWAASSQPL